jgi:beta-phosphoglucomutase-like phosphatase (HAD superfamily)
MSEQNINDLLKLPVSILDDFGFLVIHDANNKEICKGLSDEHATLIAQAINSYAANQERLAELESHAEQLGTMAEKMLESFIEFIDTLQARGLPLTDQSVIEMERMKADLARLKNG